MEAIELIERVGRGEDSRTQFKLTVTNAESLAADIVAFANAKGGRILIGVGDKGELAGLPSEEVRRINQVISNVTTNNVRPSVNTFNENVAVGDGKVVLVVEVPHGLSKPYSDNNGVFWTKAGSDKRRVNSREEIQRMFQEADLVYADEVPVDGTSEMDLDMDHFAKFFAKHRKGTLRGTLRREGLSSLQLLNNLGLVREQNLNLAGLLLFGRDPQRHRPAFVVKAVSFVGNDLAGSKYRDSEDIGGCLRDMQKATMSFLTRNLRRVQGDKGFNTEGDLEIPITALEEVVVNMFLHRDYFVSAPWRIMIFDNRVEIISPGTLPNSLSVANIRNGVSVIRNPIIASFATKEMPYRGIGTGISRALSDVPDLALESDQERNLFIVRIPRRPA